MASAPGVCFSLFLFIQVSTCDYIPSWSCDFEHSLCHWLQAKNDQLEFKHVTGDYVGWDDHTTDSVDGKLLYLVNDHGYNNFKDKPGILMSPVLMPNNGSCKMTLHYKIFGYFVRDKAQVFVNMVTKMPSGSIHRRELFQSQKHDTQSWKSQDVILQSNVEFQVEITGVIHSKSVGKLGIDDVWFSNGCRINEQSPIRLIQLWSSPSYNYPAGIFYQNFNGSWSSICSEESARSACNLLGLKDVLTGNSSSSYHLTSGQALCLPSNVTIPTAKTCNGESSCTNVTYWECKQEYISFCPKLTHKACTSAMNHLVCISDNQICDFYNNCPGGEDESDCLGYNRCDFQNDTCDWIAGKHTLYEWKRYFDISLGQYYLKVDTLLTDKEEVGVALLKLNYTIQGSQNSTCGIRFAFSLGGSLRLLIKSNNRTEVVWSALLLRSRWRQTYVELPSNGTYKIIFEAGVERFYRKYREFLLANVSFTKHCTFTNHPLEYSRNDPRVFVCHSGDAVSRKFVCDFKKDCYDGSDEGNCDQLPGRCNFESSFCDWQIGSNAPEQLQRWKAYGSTWPTGPSRHHKNIFTSGYYALLDTRRVNRGAYAYLISRTMQRPVTNKCTFRWFYHMFSSYWYRDKSALSIIYKDLHDQSERILWQVKNVQGDYWNFGSVTFDVTSFLYKIYIRAERDYSYRSDVAIDDVSFAPECLQIQDAVPITISTYGNCSAFKRIVSGSTASIFQYGSGVAFCSLSIQTDPRLRVNLYAEFFRTGLNEKVVISAGGSGQEFYGGEFSGSLQPFSLISSTNNLRLVLPPVDGFGSHAFTFNITSTDKPGHSAIYYRPSGVRRIDVVRNCKGSFRRFVLFSPTFVKDQTLLRRVTPRMVSDRYYRKELCSFKFVASNSYRIKFFFHIFDTESKHDYLQILNNGIIGQNRFSGKHAPFQFVSKRDSVDMLFYSDGSVQKVGFSLSVIATDENAMPYVPRSHLHSTTPRLTTTAPRLPLIERCSKQLSSRRHSEGSHIFGEIYLYMLSSSSYRFASSSCSWRFYGEEGVKYLLELTRIDLGSSSNSLSVEYGTGKWKNFTGTQNGDKELIEIGNQFSVTLNVTENRSLRIYVRYSKRPGCYLDSFRSYYEYKYKADSRCYCEGYKYGFLDGGCYCGNEPPSYYGYSLQNPSHCTNCSNCRHGLLFIHTHEYNKWLHEKETTKDSEIKPDSFTIAIAFTVVLCVLIFGVCMYYCRKKRASSPRNENVTAEADTAENEGSIGPSAHFINASCPEGNLPSYEEATNVSLLLPGSRRNSQNSLQPGIDDGQRSLNAAQDSIQPPHYSELFQPS